MDSAWQQASQQEGLLVQQAEEQLLQQAEEQLLQQAEEQLLQHVEEAEEAEKVPEASALPWEVLGRPASPSRLEAAPPSARELEVEA